MKKTDKVSLKRAFATNHRALKLIYKHYPQMVVSQLLSVVWNALTPYVGIFLSALVIDELAGGKDVKRLQMLVIITLASAAMIALGTALFNKWKETQNAGWWLKIEHIVSEKMLDTDYVNLDDTHTAEMLSTIRQNFNGGGWGLGQALECYKELCSSILTILGGLALTVSLFAIKVPSDAGSLTLLNNPFVVLGVVIVMLAVTFIAPMLNNKAGSYYAKHANSHNLGNRLFGFSATLVTTLLSQPTLEYIARIKSAKDTIATKKILSVQMACSHISHEDQWDCIVRQVRLYRSSLQESFMPLFALKRWQVHLILAL